MQSRLVFWRFAVLSVLAILMAGPLYADDYEVPFNGEEMVPLTSDNGITIRVPAKVMIDAYYYGNKGNSAWLWNALITRQPLNPDYPDRIPKHDAMVPLTGR
jgi:hypothetical protein